MGYNNEYEVKQVHIKAASYSLLILRIPENEINDKLTWLSREKGLITKSLYNDFLIATCIANISQFLEHLNQKHTNLAKLNEIRGEVVKEILEINKSLEPKNLVINKNHVLKIRGKRINKNDMLLTKNEFWDKDIYKDSEEVGENDEKKANQSEKLDKSKVKNLKDIPYTSIQKFWKRIGTYVIIKQFEGDAVEDILIGRSFNTRSAFEQYVVTVCVEEMEDLYVRLDKLGLPQRVAPPILVHELYELCRASNPTLDFDVYKDNFKPESEEDDDLDPFAAFHKTAEAGADEDTLARKKKIKLFKHLKKSMLLDLGDRMKKRVIGQDEAINNLVDAIQRASVGLKDPDQPIGSFVFTGPTGCGKTLSAKILAEELIGDKRGIVIIDCSEYTADHEYAKLIGSPVGYIGHEQGGYLTNAIKKQPFSIILFDEIEKASEKVHQLLLQIMDEARLTDGKGHHVLFRDTIILMTSNLGVNELRNVGKTIGFGDVSVLTPEKREKAIKEALKKKFKPEFLNRITGMINFGVLRKENYMEIIKIELNKLRLNLKLNRTDYSRLELGFDESLYEYVYEKGIDEKYGARPLKRAIEKEISTPLARKLLKENISGGSSIHLYLENDELKMDVKEAKPDNIEIDDPPFYLTAGAVDKENE